MSDQRSSEYEASDTGRNKTMKLHPDTDKKPQCIVDATIKIENHLLNGYGNTVTAIRLRQCGRFSRER